MHEQIGRCRTILDRELGKELNKIEGSGTFSPDNIKVLKDAFKLRKLMMEQEEDNEYSSRRGRSRTTGRYVSRDSYDSSRNSFGSYDGSSNRGSYRGYSGHGNMIERLERMYDESHDEKERQMIDEWIQSAEQRM